MATFVCPQCGDRMSEMELRDYRCLTCDATLPYEVAWQPASAESSQPSEHIAAFDVLAKHASSPLPPEPTPPEAKIRRSDHGETLAVLALLLPLVAQGLILACHFDSWGIGMALGCGTIVVTALLLAVDAVFLGIIDLRGTDRNTPLALFFGVLFIWIIGYPMAFFRRRHFGRPNLGPLAILVAGFFVAVPFLQQFSGFGVLEGAVPTCTSREVTGMVDDIIRKSDVGPSVQSISGHREISYDSVNQTRKGQCQVKTKTETHTATFSVKLLNRKTGTFQIDVEPIIALSCTSPEVKAMVEDMIRQSPKGQPLKAVGQYRETHYDRATQTRSGECQVKTATAEFAVTYQVKPINDKWFEVKITGGLDRDPIVIRWELGQQWQQPGQQWQQPGQPWQQPGQPWHQPGQQWRGPGQPWPPQRQPGGPPWQR